jgi:hypothetical protein
VALIGMFVRQLMPVRLSYQFMELDLCAILVAAPRYLVAGGMPRPVPLTERLPRALLPSSHGGCVVSSDELTQVTTPYVSNIMIDQPSFHVCCICKAMVLCTYGRSSKTDRIQDHSLTDPRHFRVGKALLVVHCFSEE